MTVELLWRSDYVIVDGHTYRNRPEWLILARNCELLPLYRACFVLGRIAAEDPRMLASLCTTFRIDLPSARDSLAIRDRLHAELGPPPVSAIAPPGQFARLYVLERKRPTVPREPLPKPKMQPRTLSEMNASVSLALVDEWGNPLADLPFELAIPDGGQRSGSFDSNGEAIESNVAAGLSDLGLSELGAEDWETRRGPPDGWLRKGVSIVLRDRFGVPIGGVKVKIVFANGVSDSQTLDAAGLCRVEESPSWPLRVEFPDFDPESFS